MLVSVTVGETVEARPRRRSGRALRFALTIVLVLGLLFVLPWWTLVLAGNHWPGWVIALATTVFGLALLAFPALMFLGHGKRHLDWAARVSDVELGVIWVL